jgi:hypothetical protein
VARVAVLGSSRNLPQILRQAKIGKTSVYVTQ